MSTIDRRTFLSYMAAGVTTPFLVSLGAGSVGAATLASDSTLSLDSSRVFGLSIASGDPSPTGVVLWTRVNPDAVRSGQSLIVQIAIDDAFQERVFEAVIEPQNISIERDYTVSIDVDGYLNSSQRYFYRFIYDGTASKTGRCRTAPPYDADMDSLKLGMVTCQDFTNGYYGAFEQIANDDSIDFVVHLGDFIYETVGDPSFQSLPYEDRLIILPSQGIVALDLEDYRHLYRTYRRDPFLQHALEQHTFIFTRDDHETANDAYWDYERETLGAPDHPYTIDEQYGNQPERLNQLMLDSQQAWIEYVPARVQVNLDSTDPHQFLKYYRKVQLGTLIDLFMLDGRTYRSAHACGEGTFLERYAPYGCNNWANEEQTMLGHSQRDWLIDGLAQSSARWKVLGNQTYMGAFAVTLPNGKVPMNIDAWDGFDFERNLINQEVAANQVENFVVMTGDFHSYMASHIKKDYDNRSIFKFDNYIGVEFMTPAVTSAGLFEMIGAKFPKDQQELLAQALTNTTVRATNPHVRYFNSIQSGYSTLEFKDGHCDWKAYVVDKSINEGSQAAQLIRHYRKYTSFPWLITQAAIIV